MTAKWWDPAVDFQGEQFTTFAEEYWGRGDRRALLIAGAGFDPRAGRVAQMLGRLMGSRLSGVFLREERPGARPELVILAEQHLAELATAVPTHQVVPLSIFALDSAVVGGREAALIANNVDFGAVNDVIVDLSALSIGTSFPLCRVLFVRAREGGHNLHAVVVADAVLDAEINPVPTEAASVVHGFTGGWGLDANKQVAKLWLPQLATRHHAILERIFREVAPHDVCPILPFPAGNPRAGDELLAKYISELESTWGVDPRNLIYAAEENPLDLYRTILDVHDSRLTVFAGDGGSMSILSPVGSKVMALGAMMAAIERDFPVFHVEAVGFDVERGRLDAHPRDRGNFAHVWLTGDAYVPAVGSQLDDRAAVSQTRESPTPSPDLMTTSHATR